MTNKQTNYDEHSHFHCWDQKVPACGIKKEDHKRCCLCEKIKSELIKEEVKEAVYGRLDGIMFVQSNPQPIKDWEEFDKEFPDAEGYEVNYNKQAIKSFISQNFISKKELERVVEGMRVLLHIDEKRGDNIGVEERWGEGYNQALDDLLELLR